MYAQQLLEKEYHKLEKFQQKKKRGRSNKAQLVITALHAVGPSGPTKLPGNFLIASTALHLHVAENESWTVTEKSFAITVNILRLENVWRCTVDRQNRPDINLSSPAVFTAGERMRMPKTSRQQCFGHSCAKAALFCKIPVCKYKRTCSPQVRAF